MLCVSDRDFHSLSSQGQVVPLRSSIGEKNAYLCRKKTDFKAKNIAVKDGFNRDRFSQNLNEEIFRSLAFD
jgi:hypothetical protein